MAAEIRALRGTLIVEYHRSGYSNKEILKLLEKDGFKLSYSHLKKLKADFGLKSRGTNVNEVVQAIQTELTGSGQCLGYRSMVRRLKLQHGLVANEHLVRGILQELDPEGVDSRRRRRLRRRQYVSQGPLHVIHIDGYDKLKPYGFAIHGAVDGFSRRVLWLRVGCSNNNPRVVAGYFIDWLKEEGGTAKKIRMDAGTENRVVEAIQRACIYHATNDDHLTERSVQVGQSVTNQRIERMWGILRKMTIQFFMDLFHDLVDEGLYHKDNAVQCECLRFCFMRLLQQELDRMKGEWNSHRIQSRNHGDLPASKPDLMYSLPEQYGKVSCKVHLPMVNIEEFEDFVEREHSSGSTSEMAEIFDTLMQEKGLSLPSHAHEALTLYGELLDALIQ